MAKNPFGVIGEATGANRKANGPRRPKKPQAIAGVNVRLATPKGKTAAEGRANNRASANRRRRNG